MAALVVLVALMLLAAACSSTGDTDEAAALRGDTARSTTTVAATTTTFPEPELPPGGPGPEFLALSLEDKIADFLAAPNSDKGAAVADAMGDSGDARWGPWLLDIYRLGRSTRIDKSAAAAFAKLSGIDETGQRTDDYRNFGNWVYNNGVDPGPGYREWKLAIYGQIDDEFVDLLAETPSDDLLVQIQWGGVTRGGIPELNDPVRLPVSAADWMVDDELILGAVVEGEAVAYPVRILGHHELANDEIAGIPVSMIYCTLCRSGLLFDRRVGEQVLDFQTSGLLIESNKIMVDNQTDTLWRHQTGVGLTGPLEGVALTQFPVSTVTWAEWVAEHPDSEVLDIPDPIFFDNPEQPPIAYPYEAGEAYWFYYEDPDVWFPVFDTPDVFELKESVLGLSDGEDSLALQVAALVDGGPRVFEVGSLAVAAVPTSSGARVYDVTGAGVPVGALAGVVASDAETLTLEDGSTWSRLVVPQLFWFAWFGQHPRTDWWPA